MFYATLVHCDYDRPVRQVFGDVRYNSDGVFGARRQAAMSGGRRRMTAGAQKRRHAEDLANIEQRAKFLAKTEQYPPVIQLPARERGNQIQGLCPGSHPVIG